MDDQISTDNKDSRDVKNTEQLKIRCTLDDDLDTLPWRFVDLLTNVKVELTEGDTDIKLNASTNRSSDDTSGARFKFNDIAQNIKKEDERPQISFDFSRSSGIDADEVKIIPTGDISQVSSAKQRNGYQCNHCGRFFQDDCNDNIQESGNKKCFICHRCKKSFSEYISHNIHLIDNKEKKLNVQNYSCSTCNKIFTSKTVLKRHLLKHGIIIDFICKDCGKCFNNVPGIQHYKYLLKGVKKYKCNEYEIVDKSSVEIHLLVHICIKKRRCRECGKIFRRNSSISKHCLKHKGYKSYECKVCKKCFSALGELKTHLTTHEGMKQFKCNECEKYFASKQGLKLHMTRHVNNRNYVCDSCGKCFVYKRCYVSHCSVHGFNHKCDKCLKCFTDEEALKTHLCSHKNIKNYVCHCGKSFVRKGRFISHLSKHSTQYKCHDCENFFTDKPSFEAHIMSHENNYIHKLDYKCGECNQAFSDKQIFESHTMNHKRGKKFVCHCGKVFVYKGRFISHSSKHNDQFKCDECQKYFTDKQSLESHMTSHQIHKKFVCHCGIAFVHKARLISHSSVHNPKYKCNQCKVCFTDKHNLEAHMVSHKINKKYVCHCGKAFHLKSHFIFHSSKHIVQYKCDECQKYFTDKQSLETHMTSHKTEERYICRLGETFVHKRHFISHSSVHDPKYKCDECNDIFIDKQSLEKHLITHKSNKKYECHCGKSFVREDYYVSHSSKHNVHFKCDECLECITDKQSFEAHIMSHKSNKSSVHDLHHKCGECKECFTDKQSFEAHIISHKSNKSSVHELHYKCDECKEDFTDKQSFEAHISSHKSNKKFICHCGKAFVHESLFISHSSLHDNKTAKYDECTESSTDKLDLKTYTIINKSKEKYVCHCGKPFVHKGRYISHSLSHDTRNKCEENKESFTDKSCLKTRTIMNKSKEKYVCHCGKSFVRKGRYISHSSMHDTKNKCGESKESFTDKLSRETHTMIHKTKEKYVCHCGKAFVNKGRYISHSSVHSVLFKCNECQNCFSNKQRLKIHMKVHKTNEKYICHCGKAFVQKGRFISHSSRHSIQYQCDECKNCFSNKNKLKAHMSKSHRSVRNYMCNICSKVFVYKYRFISHSSVHKVQNKCDECKKCFASKSMLSKHLLVHVE